MKGDKETRKIYVTSVLTDSLRRLKGKIPTEEIPVSEEELQILAKRARESFRHREKGRPRFEKYQAHLSKTYGKEIISRISGALEEINNRIGWEEK